MIFLELSLQLAISVLSPEKWAKDGIWQHLWIGVKHPVFLFTTLNLLLEEKLITLL